MGQRELFVDAIRSKIGSPYIWGGMGPDTFDCAGLVTYGLNAIGYILPKQNTYMLIDLFGKNKVNKAGALPGTLLFYNNNEHVMVVLSRWTNGTNIIVGARGGDGTTTTLDRAKLQAAFVDTVPDDYWLSSFTQALDPFLGK